MIRWILGCPGTGGPWDTVGLGGSEGTVCGEVEGIGEFLCLSRGVLYDLWSILEQGDLFRGVPKCNEFLFVPLGTEFKVLDKVAAASPHPLGCG